MAERADSLVAGHKASRISGLLLLALGAFLLVSLATHSALDPPNSSRTGAQVTVNRAGWVGAHASWAMLTAVGYAAYAVPLLAGLWAWNRFRRRPWQGAAARSAGIAGVALILSAGAGLPPWSQYTTFEYGGWLGTWTTGAVLVPLTGRLGSAILLGGLLGASFLLATDIDPRRVARTLSAWRSRVRRRRPEKPGPAAGEDEEAPAETPPKAGRLPTISREEPPAAAAPGPPAPGEPGSAGPEEVPLQTDSPAELLTAEAPADGNPPAEPEEPPLPGAEEIPAVTRGGNGSAGNGKPRPEARVSRQAPPEPQASRQAPPEPPAPREAPRPEAVAPESRAPRTGTRRRRRYRLPGAKLLDPVPADRGQVDRQVLLENARILEEALANFDVMGKVVEVSPGPVVTRYEVEPAAGVKVGRISALADDLARVMSAQGIRIQAPVPGKSVVGVEIANHHRETVYLREIVESRVFRRAGSELTLALGKTIAGETCVTDLAKMPHLLVAGATGSGKSVCINGLICSLLLRYTPEEVRLLMVDPKVVELTIYNDIPHLLVPVITEPKKAAEALRWAVAEMEARYQLLARMAVRNLSDYNAKVERVRAAGDGAEGTAEGEEVRKLPYIVIVVDEFADLMLTAPADVEGSLMGLAQKSRAVGIHIILATQRPSVNVITGVIKANFPSRIAFLVASKTDSRTILDVNGAERLLGRGDMLFLRTGQGEPIRIHGAYISGEETERLVEEIRDSGYEAEEVKVFSERGGSGSEEGDRDELFDEAVGIVLESKQASTSYLQRRMKVGYSRAARLMDELELAGIVGPAEGARPRRILGEDGDDPAPEETR